MSEHHTQHQNDNSKKYTYEQIPLLFLGIFPDFKVSEDYKTSYMDIPYPAMAAFGNFFVKYINKVSSPESDPYVHRVFSLVNELYDLEKSDQEAMGIINLEFFEPLSQDKKGTAVARKLTKNLPEAGFSWIDKRMEG